MGKVKQEIKLSTRKRFYEGYCKMEIGLQEKQERVQDSLGSLIFLKKNKRSLKLSTNMLPKLR
jgi:hypothetical protein